MLHTNYKLIVAEGETANDEIEKAAVALSEMYPGVNFEVETYDIGGREGIPGINVEDILNLDQIREALPQIAVSAFGPETIELPGLYRAEFRHSFTDEEMANMGREIADLIRQQGNLYVEKKAEMDRIKSLLDQVEAQMDETAEKIRTGAEDRTVNARMVLDFEMKLRLYMDDEGNVISQKPFLPEDYQRNLFEKPGFAVLETPVIPLLESAENAGSGTVEAPFVEPLEDEDLDA